MKIVFFGTGSFAVPAMRAVAKDVALVVTQPDRPSGRGFHSKPSEVRLAALDLGLPVAAPENAKDPDFVEKIRSINADALVVASYGQILPQALLDSARCGAINLHGSLLPKYRGAAPIQRCIQDGDHKTGVTLMQMDKGMDTGDVIAIGRTDIDPDETYGELQIRLANMASEMIRSWMPRIDAGDYPREAQDASLATIARKVEKSEALLVWDKPAAGEYDRFRAFTPSPGAFLRTSLGIVKLSKAHRAQVGGTPGSVLTGGAGCLVAFVEGSLDLLEVQPEGKRRMSGRDFMNGFRLRPGASLR